MTQRELSPKVSGLVIGGVLVAALAAVGITWVVEKKRDLVADVPGLGKFVIRDPGDVIQSHLFLGKAWEPEAVKLFEKYITPGSVVADIGAYNGVHSIRFAKLAGPQGHVYAFEPNPASVDMLNVNVHLNDLDSRITVYPFGLAEKSSTEKLFTRLTHNQGGTVVCSAQDIREHSRGCQGTQNVETPMVRVDDDIARVFPRRVTFAKIDVEGYEDRVLNGSLEWLKRDHPILWVEIWDDNQRALEHMPTTQAGSLAIVQSLGYREALFIAPWDHLFVPGPASSSTPAPTSRPAASPGPSASAAP